MSSLATGSSTTSYAYTQAGNLIFTAEPNGVTETRGYDAAAQLTSVTDATTSATLDSYGLTLTANGQPAQVAVTQDGTAQPTRYYGYDTAGRLTSDCRSSTGASACSAASSNETAYAYDAAGNLASTETSGVTTINSYNAGEAYYVGYRQHHHQLHLQRRRRADHGRKHHLHLQRRRRPHRRRHVRRDLRLHLRRERQPGHRQPERHQDRWHHLGPQQPAARGRRGY